MASELSARLAETSEPQEAGQNVYLDPTVFRVCGLGFRV